jgi:hypothetical protein
MMRMSRGVLLSLLVAACGATPLTPIAAQTDTAAATTLKDLRRACATTTAKRSYGYLCDDTTLVKRWPSTQPPTPTPTPTPHLTDTPTPTPTPVPAPTSGDAELPRVFLNTAMSNTPSPGRTLRVGLPGGTVQAALDSSLRRSHRHSLRRAPRRGSPLAQERRGVDDADERLYVAA